MSAAYVTKSPWVVHYDGSSCNGCDIEVLACLTPMYDVERFGIINCGNPKHADVFLVTGSVNEQNKGIVKQITYPVFFVSVIFIVIAVITFILFNMTFLDSPQGCHLPSSTGRFSPKRK